MIYAGADDLILAILLLVFILYVFRGNGGGG
jgi:hypothetical protein